MVTRYFQVVVLTMLSLVLIGCEKSSSLTVDLGAGKTMRVPIPQGFRALGQEAPAFRAQIQDRSDDLLIEAFLDEKDYRDVMAGKSDERDRELKLMSHPSLWTADFDEAAFQNKTAALRSAHYDVGSMERRANNQLNDFHQKYGDAAMKDSSPSPVEKLFDEPYAVGVMECFTLTKNEVPSKNCSAQVEMLVSQRIVTLYVLATIHNDADVDWVRSTARSMTLGIHDENRPHSG
jgi:hypothetical protein